MAETTKLFSVLPWIGGVNTSKDSAMIQPNELTKADNIIMGVDSSKQRRTGINFNWDDASSGSDSIIDLHDFWFGTNGKTQRLVSISDAKNHYIYTIDGTRSTLTDNGTPYPSNISTVTTQTFENRTIIAVDGSNNKLKQIDGRSGVPTEVLDLGRSEVFQITTDAQASANYHGTYADFESPTVEYRMWFDLDNSSTPPAAAGRTLIEVNVTSGDSANTIALAIETALEAVGSGAVFSVEVTTNVAEVTIRNPGDVTDAVVGASAPGGAFVISVLTQGISAPEASIVAKHLGRLVTNDKENLDRVHYCETSNAEVWQGWGDSGAIDIRPGDGDPEGITAIAPFKGDLIVFKSNHIYRIIGTAPETITITQISNSIGCIGPNAVADIDGNDLIFISKRGVHSLVATDKFGDIEQTYLSRDIQKTFVNRWNKNRLKYCFCRYLPSENSVAIAVTDKEFSTNQNKCIWFYHVVDQTWYRWPNISAQSIAVVDESDRQRFFIGTSSTKVARTLTDDLNDTAFDGTAAGVEYEVDTGFINVSGSPYTLAAFKNIGLVFKAQGTYDITVKIRIDNLPEQTVMFSETNPGDLLGSTFILGQSSLGIDNVMAAHVREIQGYGKYIRLRILMSGDSEQLDLQGFLIEYEEAGVQKEVINAQS